MTDRIDTLKSLHKALIDSRNGYQEALDDADGKGLTQLFRDMITLRTGDAAEISRHLSALGESVDDSGSFMTTVHKAIMDVRSLFNGLGDSILPGLIDGEERILRYYDDAIKASPIGNAEHSALIIQHQILERKISDMKLRKAMAA